MSGLRKMNVLGRFEFVGAVLGAAVTVLALWDRHWVETLLGAEPDAGDGSLEWLLVAVPALIAVACAFAARRTWLALTAPTET